MNVKNRLEIPCFLSGARELRLSNSLVACKERKRLRTSLDSSLDDLVAEDVTVGKVLGDDTSLEDDEMSKRWVQFDGRQTYLGLVLLADVVLVTVGGRSGRERLA